jgi:hypothetical protein
MSDYTMPRKPSGGHYGTGLYGRAETRKTGGVIHADKFGTNIAIRSDVPPPACEYDKWLDGRNIGRKNYFHKPNVTGFRLRRAVIMRRDGATWKDIADATGLSRDTLRSYLEFLPMGMGV